MKKFRTAYDTWSLWQGKGRDAYIKTAKGLGIVDICECDDYRKVPKRIRAETGIPGLTECKVCLCLVWPLCAVYECDECMEPVLSNHYPVKLEEDFYCEVCI